MRPDPITYEIRPITLDEFRVRILNLYRPPLRSRGTFVGMRRALDILEQLGDVRTTADLTTSTIARFVQSRHGRCNPNTTRGHLSKLSAACNIAVAEGWLRISPFAVRKGKGWLRSISPKPPKVHSRAEIARVLALAAADVATALGVERFKARRLQAIAAIACFTGMRRMEILTLRREDIDLDAGVIDLKARVDGQLKTDAAAQMIPMPDALVDILRPWLDHLERQAAAAIAEAQAAPTPASWLNVPGRKPHGGRPPADPSWTPQPPPPRVVDPGWVIPNISRTGPWRGGMDGRRPGDALKDLGRRAGVAGFTFQSLRHSWATHAEFWGFSDTVIQRILRHSNTRTQQRYRHAELNNLRALLGPIDFGPPDAGDRRGGGR